MRLFSLLLFLGYASAATASSPGMVEGPPGCSWDAIVIGAGMISSVTDETFFTLRLEKEHGRCMAFVAPATCGIVGKEFRVAVPGTVPELYRPGTSVRVWVADERASLNQPPCIKTPITR